MRFRKGRRRHRVGEDEVDNAEGTAHLCAIDAMFASVLIELMCFV
jgi:hypothetical protein